MFRRGSGRPDRSVDTTGGSGDGGSVAGRELGPLLEPAESVLAEIDDAFDTALRLEQEAYADALVEEAERTTTFRDRLLRLRHGRPVRLHLVAGTVVTGRVTAVGVDWFTLTCADTTAGLGAGAVWDLRLEAVAGLEMPAGEHSRDRA